MALTSAHAARNGVDELGGVGVLRRGEKLLGRALLNDVTALHHGNARADATHDLQIVRDEQHRDAAQGHTATRQAAG